VLANAVADEAWNISRNEENDPLKNGDRRLIAFQFLEHL